MHISIGDKNLTNENKFIKDDFSNFINENKIISHTVNGISRFLILWIINYNKCIHGYAIMKEWDNFFDSLIKEGLIKKSSPSKIYPILKKMEEEELIKSHSKIQENQEVKFYQMTEKGVYLLYFIQKRFFKIKKSSMGNLFFEDFLDNGNWDYTS